MLFRSEEGTLTHTRYKGVALTDEGKRLALRILRKHRLWEMFLVEVLHFRWDEIDNEAERFEHIMSERMEEKIDEVLGHPRLDPHGDPIPTKDGEILLIESHPLSDCDAGTRVRVLRVSDADSELLQYVSSIGIALNKELTVRRRLSFDRSLMLEIDGMEITVSATVAENIFVENVMESTS